MRGGRGSGGIMIGRRHYVSKLRRWQWRLGKWPAPYLFKIGWCRSQARAKRRLRRELRESVRLCRLRASDLG